MILRKVGEEDIPTNPPEVVFTYQNPAYYKVDIKNATSPFYLVLSTAYDPNWFAYLGDNSQEVSLNDDKHFIANGFSNGWYIDKPGTYSMILEYLPDRNFILSQKLSIIFVGLSLVVLLLKLKVNA